MRPGLFTKLRLAWRRWRKPLTLGQRGELAAEAFLRGLGYRIVHRNYKILGGELDLVAVDGRTVVFVEVKTFAHAGYDRPEERVDLAKRRQLTRVATAYRKRYGVKHERARFDVIGIVWPADAKRPDIKHIRNAFDAEW